MNVALSRLGTTSDLHSSRQPAADISVYDALQLARGFGGVALGEVEQAYMARVSERDAFRRALESCPSTRAWVESSAKARRA